MKPHDIIGLHACSACHDNIDGRSSEYLKWQMRELSENCTFEYLVKELAKARLELSAWQGVGETIARLIGMGWTIRKPEGGLLDAYDQTDKDYERD